MEAAKKRADLIDPYVRRHSADIPLELLEMYSALSKARRDVVKASRMLGIDVREGWWRYEALGDLASGYKPCPWQMSGGRLGGSRNGWVYFVQGSDQGLIKIGHARRPSARLATLQSASPIELHIIAVEPGSRLREQKLHAQFGHLREHHEWFRPEEELLRYIEEIGSTYGMSVTPIYK